MLVVCSLMYFAGELRRNGLGDFGIAISEADVEAVGDVVAARVDLDVDVSAHHVDDAFHRLATQSLNFVQVVLSHQRLELTAARHHLRNTRQLARQVVFGNSGHHVS